MWGVVTQAPFLPFMTRNTMIAIMKSTMKTPTPTPALKIPSIAAQELIIMEMKMNVIAEIIIDLFTSSCFDYGNESKR